MDDEGNSFVEVNPETGKPDTKDIGSPIVPVNSDGNQITKIDANGIPIVNLGEDGKPN